MSLEAMLDASKDIRESENIGRAIANSRRRVRTRKLITIIGEQNGTQSEIEIRNKSPLNS
jgi:hypothetical protein